MVFDLLKQMSDMKNFFLLILLSLSTLSYAQEFDSAAVPEIPEFPQLEPLSSEDTFFGTSKALRPSLSLLTSAFPESKFSLKEINFSKEKKREVNIIAMMERTRFEKEGALVEMESPMPTLSNGEKALIEVTNEIRRHDRSSNFDIYTGEKKIPAYEEMRVPLFSSPYHTRSRARGYISPYYY